MPIHDPAAAGGRLARLWDRLAPLPAGRWLFSRVVIPLVVPYSGTIRPLVRELAPGHAVVSLRDTRRVRNHVGSVHAIAIANLAELASGLAMALALPPEVRGIPVKLDVEYIRKARGTLTCVGRAVAPSRVVEASDALAHAEVTDASGTLVARLSATWRLAPLDG
jgi:acyl-coenzyme A thioesterase PaaI-like protein